MSELEKIIHAIIHALGLDHGIPTEVVEAAKADASIAVKAVEAAEEKARIAAEVEEKGFEDGGVGGGVEGGPAPERDRGGMDRPVGSAVPAGVDTFARHLSR